MADGSLSAQQFGWEHVKRSVDPRDLDMVEDYATDLSGKHPSEMSWRYGTHPVPAGFHGDDDRREPGYTESLRSAVAVGRTPPIIVVKGKVVDGWHRLGAASRNGQRTVEAWHGE